MIMTFLMHYHLFSLMHTDFCSNFTYLPLFPPFLKSLYLFILSHKHNHLTLSIILVKSLYHSYTSLIPINYLLIVTFFFKKKKILFEKQLSFGFDYMCN
ncbi:hypothetical protein WN943_003332 [Citrus x changshan-huyou]